MSVSEHRAAAPERLRFAVLTVSDTRTIETDEGGALACELIAARFHEVTRRDILRDDPPAVRAWVIETSARADVDVVVLTGGTGFARRDATPDALAGLFDPPIPGFAELFRMLSFAEVGAAAMLSRACAGVVAGKPVFALPGSPSAVRLALTRLILPDAAHLFSQLCR
jgi:molybdenum cofactor biosynthesis protein B